MNSTTSLRRSTFAHPEPLESRLALAGLVTFTDVDGDLVTVRSSKGTNADLQAALVLQASGGGEQLRTVQLTAAIFQGTTLSITAKPVGASNGFVDVGQIDATGRDLKSVRVRGDLGRIRIGDLNTKTPAVVSLAVHSLGRRGMTTGAPDLQTQITGRADRITVTDEIHNARLSQVGSDSARVRSLEIGSSIVGGLIEGNYTTVSIGGNVSGTADADSGHIYASMKSLVIRGSLIGSTGSYSGTILGLPSTKVVIKGNVQGSQGEYSGMVRAGSIVVHGNVEGGSGYMSGSIGRKNAVKSAITVKGSIIGGTGTYSGWVLARSLKALSIGYGATGIGISAEDKIESVKIGQGCERTIIWAGIGATSPYGDFDSSFGPYVDATIGSVTIGGNFVESSIVAGAKPGPLGFGVGDTVQDGCRKATIGSIRIGGSVMEDTALTSYGIVGRSIKSLSIAGQKQTLPSPGQSVPIDGTDVRVHILPISLG